MLENITDMSGLIRSSRALKAEEKELFCRIFESLEEQQRQELDSVSRRVNEERPGSVGNEWEIVTALCPYGAASGLAPVLPEFSAACEQSPVDPRDVEDGCYTAGCAFLLCSYPELDGWLNRTYHARLTRNGQVLETTYRLFFSEVMLERERILERTAAQYELEQPPILSPFSRRLVWIQVSCPGPQGRDMMQLDLDFAGNGLSGVLQTRYMPVWNVEIVPKEQLPEPRLVPPPLGTQAKIAYHFSLGPGEFLFVEQSGVQRTGERRECVLLDAASGGWRDLVYWKLRLHPALPDRNLPFLFRSPVRGSRAGMDRVRTEGDLYRTVRQFCPDGVQFCGYTREPGRSVQVYDGWRAYFYSSDRRLRSGAFLYLLLRPEPGQEMFFEDRVSCLLAFLNDRYPEFRWIANWAGEV